MDSLEARRKLGIDPASETVVYIGRMDVKKGLRELVEAATALHPKRPDLHVYLVGYGPDAHIIQSLIQSKHSTGYIHALPGCAFDEVAIWMAAADLVTLPSYMEGCPNVILEALACGRPVVATDVGGIPEIMSNECGQLIPPRDPVKLAEAFVAVLDRTWNAATIATQARRSWSDVAAELLAIFNSLVSTRQVAVHAR
jgi:glycosyltransferase involved in cell wall biosynthesis